MPTANMEKTPSAGKTQALDKTAQVFASTRMLDLAVLLLPAPIMVAASLWYVHPNLQQFLGALLCVGVFAAMVCTRSLRTLFAGTAVIALILSIALANWPLRAAFAMSRATFDEIADDVRAGTEPQTPFRAGLFRIREAKVHSNGVVCLWTHQNYGGKSGFVQCPPEDPPFNLWSHIRLDASWQFVTED